MVGTRRLSDLVESAFGRLDLPEERSAVVALSGGADSAALALLSLHAGLETRALHVDHGLVYSPMMEQAAMSVAGELGIDLETVRVDVPEGPSPEGQARRARYGAFAGISLAPGEVILTGHTLDDNAETILLNLVRGAGPRGLRGIPRRRPPNIARPALGLRRDETREIAALAHLPFFDDPMNSDPNLTRNWMRHRVIPLLRQANPRILESLQRLGRNLAGDDQMLEALADIGPTSLTGRDASHPRAMLLTSPRPVANRVIMRLLGEVIGESEVTHDRVSRVWSVLEAETVRQEIGGGVVASLDGPMLVLSRPCDPDPAAHAALTAGTHRVGRLVFDVRAVVERCRVIPLTRWSAVFAPGTRLDALPDGTVLANGERAWVPGVRRFPVAWYEPGTVGYLSVSAREGTGWT